MIGKTRRYQCNAVIFLLLLLSACQRSPDMQKSALFEQCGFVWQENSEVLSNEFYILRNNVDNMGRRDMHLVKEGEKIMQSWKIYDEKMTGLEVYEDYYRADDDIDPDDILMVEFGFEETSPEAVLDYFMISNDTLQVMIQKMKELRDEAAY